MKRVDIPTTTLRRYTMAAEESGIAEQQVIATPVCIDTPRLPAQGDLTRAGGAIMVTLRCMLARATAESGSGGVPAATDLVVKSRTAESLENMGAPIATTMVRGAVAYDGTALVRRGASHGTGNRS